MAGEQKAKLSILRHYNFQSPIMYVYRVREGVSNDSLRGQLGKKNIYMPGDPSSRKHISLPSNFLVSDA